MVSTSHPDEDVKGDKDLIESTNDPWIKSLNVLWDMRLKQREPSTEDKVIQVNMGDESDPKPIFISESLSPSEKENLIYLIQKYIDVFAWNYEDMPGLDPKVAMHYLNIDADAKLVKQHQRRFYPEIMKAIESEVKKLIDSGFVREEQHPDWIANIIPVPKKNGKVQIYIDFHDLNATYPKDEFPLPITNVMINNTCGYERMSFMDGFSGYNQIKMYPEDEKHTALRIPLGVYCYTVTPFGLKNAGATYQRAMNAIFHKHLQKKIECYVDDIAVKSQHKGDHLKDLKTMFDIMQAHQMKMNPTKSFLGVSSKKFLGFIVTSKGISLDPEKVRAIQDMPPPKNSKNSEVCKLMKKGVSFVWDGDCQKVFEEIKRYLT